MRPLRDFLDSITYGQMYETGAFLRFARYGQAILATDIHKRDLPLIRKLEEEGYLDCTIKPGYYNDCDGIHLTATGFTAALSDEIDELDLYEVEQGKRYTADAGFGAF